MTRHGARVANGIGMSIRISSVAEARPSAFRRQLSVSLASFLFRLPVVSSPIDVQHKPFGWPDATGAQRAGVSARPGFLVTLFAATLFTSAFLMFVVEPMVARMVLPMLGGAPAVWNTCLVFFQIMLLAGYAYA